MKILYVCSYYKPAYVYGGPVQSFANLCEGLTRAGALVRVLTTNANGNQKLDVPLQRPINVDGVSVSYFPLDFNGLSFFYSASLSREIAKTAPNFDLIIAETLWGHALMPIAMACKQNHIPYIISARGQLNTWAITKKGLKKKVYLLLIGRRLINHASAIYCTDQIEVQAIKRLKFRPQPFVIPNGIHSSDYIRASDTLNVRAKYGIPPDSVLLLYIGRLTQIKRPDIAVDVFSAVQSIDRDIHLLMVGPDEENWRTRLVSQARSFHCEEKLHFTSLLDKKGVISALSQANLLIMPSEIQENFGNSALEALAAGVPILVSDGVPVGHWAKDAGAGRVVPCRKDSFQEAALDLLSNLDNLAHMGKLGQELVQRRFDNSVVIQQMLMQYNAIIKSGSPLLESEINLD